MKAYKNLAGTSAITHYDIGADYIDLVFKGGKTYRYTYAEPGAIHVEQMKALAASGGGLTTYLNQNVRKNYALRLR